MGFNPKIVDMIRECVSMVQFVVLINGVPRDYFKVEKGIKQGDPLSLNLFIMIVEALGNNYFLDLMVNGRLQGFKVASTIPLFVIQKFVDDTFLYGKSSLIEAQHWKNLIFYYAFALGQCINYNRSNLFFFNTPIDLQT